MDAIVKNFPGAGATDDVTKARPTQAEAEDAVRVLLSWAGDDPTREGLLDTPKRVAKAYRELFSGYDLDSKDVLGTFYTDEAGYWQVSGNIFDNVTWSSSGCGPQSPSAGCSGVCTTPAPCCASGLRWCPPRASMSSRCRLPALRRTPCGRGSAR